MFLLVEPINCLGTGSVYCIHHPYASTTYKNNDAIRIHILQSDIITAHFEISIVTDSRISGKATPDATVDVSPGNNATVFLFKEIRYEIYVTRILLEQKPRYSVYFKCLLLLREEENNVVKHARWISTGEHVTGRILCTQSR